MVPSLTIVRVLPLLIFQTGFEYLNMGYASAIAVAFLVIVMGITILQFAFIRPSRT